MKKSILSLIMLLPFLLLAQEAPVKAVLLSSMTMAMTIAAAGEGSVGRNHQGAVRPY